MDIPNYDREIERQHEPAVVLADPSEAIYVGSKCLCGHTAVEHTRYGCNWCDCVHFRKS